MRRFLVLPILALLAGCAAAAAAPGKPQGKPQGGALTVDRVVLMMRHGVRPPTKSPALPLSVTTQRWPDWVVAPGFLTPHGAQAVRLLGKDDAARFRKDGLLPASACAPAGTLQIIADSDQRTIATARAWSEALVPSCPFVATHKPQDVEDPLFNAIATDPAGLDVAHANAGVQAAIGKGGMAALDQRYATLLRRIDAILCPGRQPKCGVLEEPSSVIPAAPGKRPKLDGAIDTASTVAQVLLLEYADGKPFADIGWGRVRAADITAFSEFHALEFRLLARPRPIAAANLSGLMPHMLAVLEGKDGRTPRILMISGHDTNVANLGGLLDVHWTIPGFATDDPAPGGAIVIERLHDGAGHFFVRASYRAQTLNGIRTLSPQVVRVAMPIPGCRVPGRPGLCTLAQFAAIMRAR